MTGRRKALLTLHVLGSASSVGVSALLLGLLVSAFTSADREYQRILLHAVDFGLRAISVPGLVLALGTGLLVALGSPWGLFRHTWVLKKLVLLLVTVVLAVVLIVPWSGKLAAAGSLTGVTPWLVLGGLVLQLVKLAVITLLSVYKPKGTLTRKPARPPRVAREPVDATP